jgi:hypothetical protein
MFGTARAVSLAAIAASLLLLLASESRAQQVAQGITRADFDAIHSDFFFGADRDFNLSLTEPEIAAQMLRSPSDVQAIVDASSYDADGDGLVTYDEFTAGAATEFRRRDLNGDGVITSDEF